MQQSRGSFVRNHANKMLPWHVKLSVKFSNQQVVACFRYYVRVFTCEASQSRSVSVLLVSLEQLRVHRLLLLLFFKLQFYYYRVVSYMHILGNLVSKESTKVFG